VLLTGVAEKNKFVINCCGGKDPDEKAPRPLLL
jgi:hypothetical protein